MKNFLKILSSFIIFIAILFSFSCSVFSDNENSSIIVNFGSSRAVYSKEDTSYYIVSISPKVQEEQKVDMKTTTFAEFSLVPVGKYKISVDAYNESDEIIAKGAEFVTVKAGKTESVSIFMKTLEKMISTPIVLWNSAQNEQNVYLDNSTSITDNKTIECMVGFQLFDSVKENEKVSQSLTDDLVLDFCFDALTGDLYVLTKEFSLPYSYTIEKFSAGETASEYKKAKSYDVTNIGIDFNNQDVKKSLTYFNGKIFLYGKDSNQEAKDNIIKIFDIENSESSTYQSELATDVILYSDGKYLYTLNNDGLNIFDKDFNLLAKETNLFANYSASSMKITDITTIKNDIYILAASSSEQTSLGFIMKFTLSNSKIIPTQFNNNTGIFGFSSKTLLDNSQDKKENENNFYGPRKFIAIRPKELVIADEGSFITDGYSNPKTTNKVAILNLETMSITSTNVNATLTGFNSGCGFKSY